MKCSAAITCITLICQVLYTNGFAQNDRHQYDSVVQVIKNAMNTVQPDKIYRLTSDHFQKKMSAEQFSTGLNKFRAKNGNWTNYSYKTSNDNGFDYLAEFQLTSQLFSLKLNDEGKIERMNFAAIPTVIAAKNYPVGSNNVLADTLDRLVEQLVRPYIQKGNTAGIAIAIIHNDHVRRYSYGTVNKFAEQLPDPDKTIFEIGSVTKTFTSLLLAQQVIKNRINLNAPINHYLPDSIPWLSFHGNPVRVVHLANHTSGFPRLPNNIFHGTINVQDPYQHYVYDSLFSFLAHYQCTVKPGTVFSYSNYGAGLLATILEQQLQMDFDSMVIGKICRPLQMNHTYVSVPPDAQADFAQGYDENGAATRAWDLASLKGSGAIRSTLNDMVLYVQAQMGNKNPLQKAIQLSHATTFSGPDQQMGLGWRINTINGQTIYHHSGGTGGYRSYVGFDVKRGLGIVILSNAAEEVTAIGERLLLK